MLRFFLALGIGFKEVMKDHFRPECDIVSAWTTLERSSTYAQGRIKDAGLTANTKMLSFKSDLSQAYTKTLNTKGWTIRLNSIHYFHLELDCVFLDEK